jgi:hypothetical protein
MTLRIALTLMLAASVAHARPSVTVAPDAPFTERELGEALALRVTDDVDVHVTRDRDGRLVVTVSGKQQIVDPAVTDPRDAARVVAMVVIALVEEPAAPPSLAPVAPPSVVPVVAMGTLAPRPSPWMLRVVGSALRDDNGFKAFGVTGTVGYHISPHARLVGSVGLGTMSDTSGDSETIVPVRLGIEGIAGALGVELGGFWTMNKNGCSGGDPLESPIGVYGAVRVAVPLRGRNTRIVLEGGGQYVLTEGPSSFFDDFCGGGVIAEWTEYAGWAGLGVEWSF